MARDLSELLGASLREIRKTTTGTQERWEERTGMSQSYLSAIERGQSAFAGLQTVAEAIEKAGVDPLQLFRVALARADGADDQADLLLLWSQVDNDTRTAILTLLRSQASVGRAAR